jgi:hypothetical protein
LMNTLETVTPRSPAPRTPAPRTPGPSTPAPGNDGAASKLAATTVLTSNQLESAPSSWNKFELIGNTVALHELLRDAKKVKRPGVRRSLSNLSAYESELK